ncbi:hypothetical protein GCM10022267_91310 [Lentzea roselyniae]|uniref:Phosphoserine phosphatase n=1 Tax=Lentzea roselyniae TaxID=531940 RepID=A0ABP7CHG9_9PSEU
MVTIAALDVDGTLLPGTLGWPLPEMLVNRGWCKPDSWQRLRDFLACVGPTGLEQATAAARAWELFADMVKGVPVAAVQACARHIWSQAHGHVFTFVPPLIAAIRGAGLEPMLVSAGPQELGGCAAAQLGIERYAGTVLEEADGVFTGGFSGVPTLGKPVVVASAAGGHEVDWARSLALGNSVLDADLLDLVGIPVAFEPTTALRARARVSGWPIADRGTVLALVHQLLATAT